MTFDIEQRTGQFLDIAKEIDAIAAALQVSEQADNQKSNTGTHLQALSKRLKHLSTEVAADIDANISRLKGMRDAVAASERQFRSLAENVPDNIARWDCAGNYLYVNPTHERTLRIPAADLIGTQITDLHKHIATAIANVVATGEALPFVRQEVRDDMGDVRVHDVSLIPERNANGAIVSVLGVGRDMTEPVRMQEALAASERQFRTLAENLPNYLARYTPDARITYINPMLESLIGYGTDEVVGRSVGQVWPDGRFDDYESGILNTVSTGNESQIELSIEMGDGQRATHQVHLVPEGDETGTIVSVLAIGRDITERKRIEEMLASREREFRTLVEHSPDMVARYGRDFRHRYVNPAFDVLFDGRGASLIGKTPSECWSGSEAIYYEQKLGEVFAFGTDVEFDIKRQMESGSEHCILFRLTPEPGANGAVESVLAVGRDITELHTSRQKIHKMAFYDALTALPNRALFNERLRQTIADTSLLNTLTGVMMIDMDRFKGINDTLGHSVGDELLREAAIRLRACVRSGDTVARFGGDEFAILLPAVPNRRVLEDISRTIINKFDERFVLGGKEVFVSCSIGIALYALDSVEAEDLMKYADSAMYSAKRSGRRSFRFYSKDLTVDATADLLLESELRGAIVRGELELQYQPKVSFDGDEVVGSEALLRWKRPGVGLIPPSQFIPIAEETGLIADIGKWVLREACLAAAEWNAGGVALHKVAVNLSARQFHFQDLTQMVGEILDATSCRPEWLELEITESLLLEESDTVLGTLSTLKSMGVTIAIDDFGTGYSALSYLARFPIDTLKIDRSFVQRVTTDQRHAELVKAILSIAACLGQQVVAEGVETAAQATFLKANGCQLAQGFLYSKPVPKSEMVLLPRRLDPDAIADRNVNGRHHEALPSRSQLTLKCPPASGND